MLINVGFIQYPATSTCSLDLADTWNTMGANLTFPGAANAVACKARGARLALAPPPTPAPAPATTPAPTHEHDHSHYALDMGLGFGLGFGLGLPFLYFVTYREWYLKRKKGVKRTKNEERARLAFSDI